MSKYYSIHSAKAPVNIAIIKYWGKHDDKLKIPINDSLSGTINLDDMCTTTSVAISSSFEEDKLWLNGEEQDISIHSLAGTLLNSIRSISKLEHNILKNCKVHIVSRNDFPTAAGLASSASGYACLAFVLGSAFGIDDRAQLSRLARQASGSACRSLYGGFVQWIKGHDHDTSQAQQVASHTHWPEMRVIICVVDDQKKAISSSHGMRNSVITSDLIHYRANTIVPQRIEKLKHAILERDFETFSKLTMTDSNQFHAICLDTYPPIFYLNQTSRQIINICTAVNSLYNHNKVAYTFDAGPNACIYLLDEFVPIFIEIMRTLFPIVKGNADDASTLLPVRGHVTKVLDSEHTQVQSIVEKVRTLSSIDYLPNAIKYLISTSIGDGPKMVDDHLEDSNLDP